MIHDMWSSVCPTLAVTTIVNSLKMNKKTIIYWYLKKKKYWKMKKNEHLFICRDWILANQAIFQSDLKFRTSIDQQITWIQCTSRLWFPYLVDIISDFRK